MSGKNPRESDPAARPICEGSALGAGAGAGRPSQVCPLWAEPPKGEAFGALSPKGEADPRCG
ncbi:hypothetical protein [Paracoccus methylarcula]|uniref:Uncharacterized protein n=1 Tax=Paracoccus methylarcula TaxID=72022 RepID=A0A3R7LJZ5_9RHOB|nr:hypothetical protein [Paracoccus methylarcula]RNF34467.1 hypothetical protein A7A09_011300 [Paracoccus methylarcula]